jgi:hypothetical protein
MSSPRVETRDRAPRELVAAADECPALATARTLAEWIGTGKPVTTRNVLKPAVAVEACDLLAIDLPSRKPRSALDIDQLMLVWSTASAAGFIEVDRGRVTAGRALGLWVDGDAENVLAIWARCALACLGLAGETAEADLDHFAVLAGLHERDGSAPLGDLVQAIKELDGNPSECQCPDCLANGFVLPGDIRVDERYAKDVVETLAEFGIAVIRGDGAELTSLGRWFTDLLFWEGAPAAELDAATLIDEVAQLPPKLAVLMSRRWLSARTPVDAARELLATGESSTGQKRLVAVTLAGECGPEAAPAWREWAAKDGFGAYARVWLVEEEGAEPADPDTAWITVDTLAMMLDGLPPDVPVEVLPGLLQAQAGDDLAEALPLLENCGHPAAPKVVALLTARPMITIVSPGESPGVPVRPPVSVPGPRYRIRVELRGVTEPSVWRRLEVPAELNLGQLHEVLQDAMGWDNYHLHVFDDGRSEYGSSDSELGHRDEWAVRLSQVLAGVGDKLGYTYDFGDGWDHDITLEALLPADPGVTGAVCVEGAGACPPEDCGGEGGYQRLKEILADPRAAEHDDMLDWLGLDSGDEFDPHLFSTEDVNQILSGYFSGLSLR